jgi:crotonobetainyl-CoA:carnitine CoA-transferase CaiB-like acyl-CoA transferase
MADQLPLDGIRVLDLGQFWAAPNAGRAWGDAGAEVIKIESCRRPDPLRIQARRIYPDHEPGGDDGDHWNRSGMVNERNRNKLSLALDLSTERGRELFIELAKQSDVVSQNYSLGVMDRLNIGWETLHEANPRLIMVSIMSQGLSGPESSYVSYGQNLEQLGGISHASGYADDDTSSVGFALPDPIGGATAAFALMSALRLRDRTGVGVHIDLSQREAATLVIGDAIVEYSLTGRDRPRQENHELGAVPSDCYPCAGEDQWIAITVRSDRDWGALCEAMDRPDLVTGDYATIVGRMRHRESLDSLVGAWTSTFDKLALTELLQSHDLTAGPVLNPRELFRDQHLRERGFWEAVEDYSAGPQEYYGRPIRLSETPLGTRLPTPKLGQHNRQILGGVLGLSDAELDRLEADGVIGEEPILTAEGGMARRSS